MTLTDWEARINKFIRDFGYGDPAMDEEFRKGVVELLTDLGATPQSPVEGPLLKAGVRKFRSDDY